VERIGFVGLGTMGASMAANLARAGAPLTVWNERPAGPRRSSSSAPAKPRARRSWPPPRTWSSSASRTAPTSRPSSSARTEWPTAPPPDRSSSTARRSRRTATRQLRKPPGRERGVGMVDAPVSGGSEGARLGTLTIFVGGSDSGRRSRPSGPGGDRADDHSPGPARQRPGRQGREPGDHRRRVPRRGGRDRPRHRAGLDPHLLVEALSGGAAQSWVLANRSGG
jgi:hypothetical protein